MRTICLKSRRRFATLSVDGKRADVLDLFATRSLLKYIVRVYLIGNISSASILPVIYRLLVPFVRVKGRGKKKVCSSFVVARNFFLRWKSLSFWRESNALKKKRSQRYWWIRGTSKYVKCVRMWSKIYVAKYLVVTSLDIQSEFPYVFDKLIVETWCKYIDNFFARFFEVKVS